MNIELTPIKVTMTPVVLDIEITVTHQASQEIFANTSSNVDHMPNHIRIGVVGSGCNGFSYVLEYVKFIKDEDFKFNSHDTVIVVDKRSYPYLKGLEIDFVKEGFKQGFIFNNPNQTASCGCGESFSI